MSRRIWFILIIVCLLLLIISQQKISHAANQMMGTSNSPAFLGENQTIPSRTFTPGPPTSPPPTSTRRSGGGGGGDEPTAVPTSTAIPQATATATLPPTIIFTPVSGFMPTAAACGSQPTIQAQNTTNVRVGPGSDYDILRTLAFLEVRPIIGRAADAAWWLIQFSNGEIGWVADEVILVQGFTGNVPMAAAPEINGSTPTPGTPWNPTPNPNCPVTPTNTPEPVMTPTDVPTAEATDTAVPETHTATATSEIEVVLAATAPPQPTQTSISPPTLAASAGDEATAPGIPVIDGEATIVQPIAAAPLDDVPARNTTDFLLPAAGILLLAAGVVTFISRRRKSEIDES